MKHVIYPEKTGTPTATSEDANYPATNLTNNIRAKVWKAINGVQAATLTVNISADASVIALDNTNAETAVVKIYDAADAGGSKIQETTHTLETASRTFDNFWEEYTEQAAAHSATILLTAAAGETVEAGIVRAGGLYTVGPPKYGISETHVGYHIEKQYKSGAWYAKKREIVRSFAYTTLLARSTKYRDLMDLYDYYGPDPFMMLITDELEDKHYTVFGKFNGEPSASHDYPDYSLVNISILEVV